MVSRSLEKEGFADVKTMWLSSSCHWSRSSVSKGLIVIAPTPTPPSMAERKDTGVAQQEWLDTYSSAETRESEQPSHRILGA